MLRLLSMVSLSALVACSSSSAAPAPVSAAGTGGAAGGGTGGSGGAGGGGGAAIDPTIPTGTMIATTDGPVSGATDGSVRSWKGLPFAAAPVGANRFRAPQPTTAWTAPRDATKFGDQCAQASVLSGKFGTGKEDCLYLNVYSPDPAPTSRAPVMVWFHGGAFLVGSGSQSIYDATHFVEQTGAVIVTVNYRLGPLGFLGHSALAKEDPDGSTGNYGLQDQRAALAWVKKNIHEFGGDPDRVAIFGESAGGFSVSGHLVSPGSAPFFQRALIESGSMDGILLPTVPEAEQQTLALATALGCSGDPIACLRAQPVEAVVAGLKNPSPKPGGLFNGTISVAVWFPIFDGGFFPIQPTEAFSSGKLAKVPTLLGTNREEAALFHAGLLGDITVPDAAAYGDALSRTFGPDAAAKVLARYPLSMFASPDAALVRLETDGIFTCAARRQARAIAKASAPVYRYQFTRAVDSGVTAALGPCHAAELPYLWGNDDVALGKLTSDASLTLVPQLEGYWSGLARTGDPNGSWAPAWPKYDPTTDPYQVLDVPPTSAAALLTDTCDFWDGLPPLGIPKTY